MTADIVPVGNGWERNKTGYVNGMFDRIRAEPMTVSIERHGATIWEGSCIMKRASTCQKRPMRLPDARIETSTKRLHGTSMAI